MPALQRALLDSSRPARLLRVEPQRRSGMPGDFARLHGLRGSGNRTRFQP